MANVSKEWKRLRRIRNDRLDKCRLNVLPWANPGSSFKFKLVVLLIEVEAESQPTLCFVSPFSQ